MITTIKHTGGEPDRFAIFDKKPDGRGRGLASVGDALAAAGVSDSAAPMAQASCALGIEARSVADALASVEQPAGPLLFAAQGQSDMHLAERCVMTLARRMAGAGRVVERGGNEWRDAVAAGTHALTVWRATGAGVDGEPDGAGWVGRWQANPVDDDGNGWDEPAWIKAVKNYSPAARVAWRAVVRELSRDWLGESIPLHTVGDDWLWHNAEQHDESRAERAARLRVERLALGRQALLLRRLDNIPAGRGQRAAVVDKVRAAAVALLAGVRLDDAATSAGFKAHGRHHSSDHLLTACKRLGIIAPRQSGEGFTVRTRDKISGKTSQVRIPARVGGKDVVITNAARRVAAARRSGFRQAVPERVGKVWFYPDGSVSICAPWARA